MMEGMSTMHVKSKKANASTHLHKDVPEGDAAEKGTGVTVVKHAKAVCAWLPGVHEQIIQGTHWQADTLQISKPRESQYDDTIRQAR